MAVLWFTQFFYLFKSHILFMFAQIDPLFTVDKESQKLKFNGSRKKHSLYALSVVIFGTIYGVYGFQLEAGLPLNNTALKNSSVIFSHQLVPSAVWAQVDFALGLDIIGTVTILMVFIIDKPVKKNYQLSKNNLLKTIFSGNDG